MNRLDRHFFIDNEVLFVGYSSRKKGFSDMVFRAFSQNGIRVTPLNYKRSERANIKAHQHLAEVYKVPKTAYLLIRKENALQLINELSEKGVKRILFQNKQCADDAILKACSNKGIDAIIGCPMMLFGNGIHRLHASLAGVKRK